METFLKTHWNEPTAVEQKVLFAEQLLQGVATATQELLTIGNYKKSIQNAMQALGQATQVDRIYIFRHHLHPESHQPLASQSWEWTNHGVAPQIDNPELQNLPASELFPRWYQEFLQGRSISGFVEMFPEQEREILEPQEILSIVVVPILIKSVYWGFMGFDDCHYGHDWSKSEVAVLKSVANSFGGAFMRHQVEESLIKKNQELEQQKLDLQKAKVEAERASETKNIFLAKVSHELRTPMNGILGYAQILERSQALGEKEARGVQVIHQCANHLLKLINDLLDISKIEAEKLELIVENVSLQALIDEVMAVCQIRADSKGVRLVSAMGSGLPKIILTDAKRLKQVLLNLIYNAIKFTEQGQVTLRVSQNSVISEQGMTALRFVVEDTGVGIASENLEMLFGAFEQLENSQGSSDGVGLGLSISQEIIQAMGSRIEVHSDLNVGSKFFFDLNLPRVASISSESDLGIDSSMDSCKPEEEQIEKIIDIVPPSRSILNILKSLAEAGRLKKIVEVAKSVEVDFPECTGFVKEITQRSQRFEIEEIESYVERFLTPCPDQSS